MAFWYWFTFVTHTGVEPTNNRAERDTIASIWSSGRSYGLLA